MEMVTAFPSAAAILTCVGNRQDVVGLPPPTAPGSSASVDNRREVMRSPLSVKIFAEWQVVVG